MRLTIRSLHVILTVGFAVPMCAASQSATVNRKPFAALSASALRLKDSVAARIERMATRVEVHDSTVLTVPEHVLRDSVVALARQQIGRRYVFGGTTPRGFDCSGLVRFVLAALRLGVPRTAAEQAWTGLAVTPDTSALRPGDLVTFGNSLRAHHVGIYTGDGKFIHASVKAGKVIESSITRRTSPLIRKWSGARRLLALGDST